MDLPGVVAAEHPLLLLDRDRALLCDPAGQLQEFPVVDGPPVHGADHRAPAQGADPLPLGQAQVVGRSGGFQHQGQVGGHGVGRRLGAPTAHLLLGGKDKGAVVLQGLFEQRQQDGDPRPVVNGLGGDPPLAQGGKGGVKIGDVPQLYPLGRLLPAGGADVDAQLAQGDLPLPLLRLLQVDGHRADDPGEAVHPHRLAGQHLLVDPADAVKAEIALLVDVGDDQRHLVHVGADHPLLRGGAGPLLLDDHTAQGVHLVGKPHFAQAVGDEIAHLLFAAGRAVQGAELFEGVQHDHSPPFT